METIVNISIAMAIIAIVMRQRPKSLVLPAILIAAGAIEALAGNIETHAHGFFLAGLIVQIGLLMVPSQKRG